VDRVSIERICAGKEFQVEGADTEKAREEKTDAWFLLKLNRKSYALYRMVALPMTLSAP